MIDTMRDAVIQVRDLITPRQYFAWQTILMLSLFSWVMAYVAEAVDATAFSFHLLSTCSWIFFTIAIWWALAENPVKVFDISISSWITGAILCTFLFNPWNGEGVQWAIVSWPVVSTVIAAIPYLLDWNLAWKVPKPNDRQGLVLTLLLNLLLSSWLSFYFRIQNWFNEYPSLLVEELRESNFVYQFRADQEHLSQGQPLLEDAAALLLKELEGAPWPRVERWLLNIDEGLRNIASQVNLAAPAESIFWSLDASSPTTVAKGYQLKLRANWLGPTSEQNGYSLEKVCTIVPRSQPRIVPPSEPTDEVQPDPTPIAHIECTTEPIKVPREGAPVTSGRTFPQIGSQIDSQRTGKQG